MKRRIEWVYLLTIVAIAGIVLTAGAGAAQAQEYEGNIPGGDHRFKIALGEYTVNDSTTAAHDSSDWILASLSYDLRRPSATRTVNFAAYIEGGSGYGQSLHDFRSYRVFTRDFSGAGLSANVRLTPPNRNFGVYALAGAGEYLLGRNESQVFRDDEVGADGQPIDQSDSFTLDSASTAHLGYKLGGGIWFGRGVSMEASYFNLGSLEDADYSGVGVTVGLRL